MGALFLYLPHRPSGLQVSLPMYAYHVLKNLVLSEPQGNVSVCFWGALSCRWGLYLPELYSSYRCPAASKEWWMIAWCRQQPALTSESATVHAATSGFSGKDCSPHFTTIVPICITIKGASRDHRLFSHYTSSFACKAHSSSVRHVPRNRTDCRPRIESCRMCAQIPPPAQAGPSYLPVQMPSAPAAYAPQAYASQASYPMPLPVTQQVGSPSAVP